MKYTPGPWKIRGNEIIGGNGSPICSMIYSQRVKAKLIAAAPDLLEALQDLLETYTDLFCDVEPNYDFFDKAFAVGKAKKAIAKAEGD